MAVFRVERTQNYTVMSNYHLRDKNLSLKAKGLLSQMLSLPEDWDYTLSGLSYINQEGKDAIRAAISELEKAGYVQRHQTMDEKGKFSVNEYVIREHPVDQEPLSESPSSGNPTTDNPTTEKPAAVSTATDNPTQRKKDIRSKENKSTDPQSIDSLPFVSCAANPDPSQVGRSESKGSNMGWKRRAITKGEMDCWREQIRDNIDYDYLVQEDPYNTGQLDELVEIMVEAVCSTRDTLRVSGNELPQNVVKERLLNLDAEHIRYVFECLHGNTTKIKNMKQYLLAVLYNAPATINNHYAAEVNHDFHRGSI